MPISEIRYGDFFSRSDALVISWSAVALMMRSARTPGSIRSTTVETPRRAAPIAARACWLELLLGGRVLRPSGGPCPAAC